MNDAERDSLRGRRILWPCNDGTAYVFDLPDCSNAVTRFEFKKYIKEWLATCTTGEFYLGYNVLCLYTEQDAMAFKLYDVLTKCKVEYALKNENV